MPYGNKEDEIKWRENNRDWHKTPKERTKQRVRRMKYMDKKLESRPDRYEYNHTNKQKIQMRYSWCRNKDRICKLRECDFERAWSKYSNTENCEICNISFKKVRKNMEHNHVTRYFRSVACQRCNGYLRYADENFKKVMNQLNY